MNHLTGPDLSSVHAHLAMSSTADVALLRKAAG